MYQALIQFLFLWLRTSNGKAPVCQEETETTSGLIYSAGCLSVSGTCAQLILNSTYLRFMGLFFLFLEYTTTGNHPLALLLWGLSHSESCLENMPCF